MYNTKCAIITGAGSGLGRAIAVRLSHVYPTLLIGRNLASLQQTKSLIEASGGKAEIICGDVRSNNTLSTCLRLLQQYSYIPEVLVCNAGIGKSDVTHQVTTEDWSATLDTNLTSVHSWSCAILPMMVTQRSGTICFISSVAGVHGIAYDSAYSASKHALVGLGKSMALEYGKFGVAVQILCPGFIEGDMTSRSIAALAKRKAIDETAARAIIAKQSPMRDIMPPEDVAETVAYLCTAAGRHFSGNPIILGAAS